VLKPLGFDEARPQASLPCCARNVANHPELSPLLLSLSSDLPAAILDLESAAPHSAAAAQPVPWNMRWALLAGSLCDLTLGSPPSAAPFWRALLDCASAPQCKSKLDLWGCGRCIDAGPVGQDGSGFVWASWLAAALLSGMLPVELSACPQVVSHALMLRCDSGAAAAGAKVAGMGAAPLEAAYRAVHAAEGARVVQAGGRVACVVVVALLMASAAPIPSMVCSQCKHLL
jgi:hypothetical protein